MEPVKRCGGCLHTEPVADDLTKVTCFGHGVQLLVVPQGIANARPQMAKTERACALWAIKEPIIVSA